MQEGRGPQWTHPTLQVISYTVISEQNKLLWDKTAVSGLSREHRYGYGTVHVNITVPRFPDYFLKLQNRALRVKAEKKILAQAPWGSLHLFISPCILIKSCNISLTGWTALRRLSSYSVLCFFFLVSQCVSQARFAPHISNLALKTELLISCRLFLWHVLLQCLNGSQIQPGYFLATSVR